MALVDRFILTNLSVLLVVRKSYFIFWARTMHCLTLIRIANFVAMLNMHSFSLVKPIHIVHVKTQSYLSQHGFQLFKPFIQTPVGQWCHVSGAQRPHFEVSIWIRTDRCRRCKMCAICSGFRKDTQDSEHTSIDKLAGMKILCGMRNVEWRRRILCRIFDAEKNMRNEV